MDGAPTVAAVAAGLARRALAGAVRPVILIDGRSGSGKTTLGNALAPLVAGAQLVGLDDLYPGWHGLEAATLAVADTVLRPVDPGYRRWDWQLSRPADWRRLDPARPLVVEGAGSLSRASAPLATLRVWVELDAGERRERVRARSDADAYAPWWDVWARQEDEHIRRESPETLADVVVHEASLTG